jgi:hypothetical protein
MHTFSSPTFHPPTASPISAGRAHLHGKQKSLCRVGFAHRRSPSTRNAGRSSPWSRASLGGRSPPYEQRGPFVAVSPTASPVSVGGAHPTWKMERKTHPLKHVEALTRRFLHLFTSAPSTRTPFPGCEGGSLLRVACRSHADKRQPIKPLKKIDGFERQYPHSL